MSYLLRVAIGVDQLLNAVLGGQPDETVSARCWRRREDWPYGPMRRVIDAVFFWQTDHCQRSYESEAKRRQLPRDYSKSPPEKRAS